MVVPGNEYDSAKLWELLCQAMGTVVPGYGNRCARLWEPECQAGGTALRR